MEGYADHDVNLLFTWDEQDKLTGVIVNIASPAQVDEAVNVVTADFCTSEARRGIAPFSA